MSYVTAIDVARMLVADVDERLAVASDRALETGENVYVTIETGGLLAFSFVVMPSPERDRCVVLNMTPAGSLASFQRVASWAPPPSPSAVQAVRAWPAGSRPSWSDKTTKAPEPAGAGGLLDGDEAGAIRSR